MAAEIPTELMINREEAYVDIFTKCKQKSRIYKKLVKGVVHVSEGLSRMNVRCLKIRGTDAMLVQPFSKALCLTEPQGKPFIIDALFGTGMEVLNCFIHGDHPANVPNGIEIKTALRNLLAFFMEEPVDQLFYSRRCKSELEWTVVVAEHLLSKLAGERYVIDRFAQMKDVLVSDGLTGVCPCPKHEKISGSFGDTSFGIENGWHGRVDILIRNTPIEVAPNRLFDEEDETMSSDCTDASKIVNRTATFSRENRMQLISQCIVHSFLKRKVDNTRNTCLTPAIGLGDNEVLIVFYDSENDILLSTDLLELEDIHTRGELNPAVVVLLWLTLNHGLFCTGVPSSTSDFKADFDRQVEDKIVSYRECVKRGIGKVLDSDDIGWADVPGKKLRTV